GMDILNQIEGRYGEDPFFQPILSGTACPQYETSGGLVFRILDGKQLLCIPDISIDGWRIREVVITHAHSILAHLGDRKTIQYLENEVWW
ncbi:hypothetical protein M405DRAFT_691007, partial [Rhizopogon salebrosus TDB-379]